MPKQVRVRCETLTSADEVRQILSAGDGTGQLAVSVATDGPDTMHAGLTGLAFAFETGTAYHLAFDQGESDAGSSSTVPQGSLDELRPLLGPEGTPKIGHDTKRLYVTLRQHGVEVGPLAFDTVIAAFLLDGKESTLEDLFSGRLDRTLGQDACAGVDAMLRLREPLTEELRARGQLDYLCDFELPLVPVLAEMELAGIGVDTSVLRALSRELEERLARLEAEMEGLAGHVFNPKSPGQLSKLLYEDLGLKPARKTASGYSTDVHALEALAGDHPIVELLLQHRQLSRLRDGYLDALPRLVSPDTRRLHTTWSQTGTTTGRLTSKEPNLQNIPVRSELGREVRRAFVAGAPDTVLLSADYSQLELRVLAHLAGEERLREAFARGEDVHMLTASRLYGVPLEEVTPDQRRTGKTINYGVIYGMTGYRLARDTGLERRQAVEFVRRYQQEYPRIREYFERTLRDAEERGYVQTPFGRRRYMPELHSQNRQRREAARRAAENMPNQGMAADIIRRAMIGIHAQLQSRSLQTRMLVQVHDELLFEAPESELRAVVELVSHEMTHAVEMSVPLEAAVKSGRSWGEMQPIAN